MNTLGGTLIRVSTDDLPERDRVPIWCDGFGRTLMNVNFEPVAGRAFRQIGVNGTLENLGVSFGETNGLLSSRTKAQLADGNDDLLLHTTLSGYSLASQRGHELRIADGDAVLLSCAEIHSHDFPEAARAMLIRVPRRALSHLVSNPEDALMRRVPASTPALRLLVEYVGLLAKQHVLASSELQRAFVTHVHDLVALILGAPPDAAELARSRGLPAARLSALKVDIVKQLGDQSLSVTSIAKRHQVTPRYVQILFETEGRTFTEFVVEQRLAVAHRRLVDSRFTGLTISAIAFEVGFGNLSYFNRAFRKRYGASPSEVREQTRRAGFDPS